MGDDRKAARPSGHEAPAPDPPDGNGKHSASGNRVRDYQRQLRLLTSELSLAEARERREIASDLHEHIGQALAYVSQKVSALKGNAVFCGMEDDFSEILTILDQAVRYTRDLTVEISPPVLYELGLAAAIDWLAERGPRRYGLEVVSIQSGEPRNVAEDIKVFIFKAIQELVTNAAKHAGAQHVTVHAYWKSECLEIEVRDDGCGFDTTSFDRGLSSEGCFGLFSIRERLSYTGGRMEIESAPGRGTAVTVSTPYDMATGETDD